MTTPEWLGIMFTTVGLAVGYGVMKGKVAQLREELVDFKAALAAVREELRAALEEVRNSNQRQGERIGSLETKAALAERELSRPYTAGKREGG